MPTLALQIVCRQGVNISCRLLALLQELLQQYGYRSSFQLGSLALVICINIKILWRSTATTDNIFQKPVQAGFSGGKVSQNLGNSPGCAIRVNSLSPGLFRQFLQKLDRFFTFAY